MYQTAPKLLENVGCQTHSNDKLLILHGPTRGHHFVVFYSHILSQNCVWMEGVQDVYMYLMGCAMAPAPEQTLSFLFLFFFFFFFGIGNFVVGLIFLGFYIFFKILDLQFFFFFFFLQFLKGGKCQSYNFFFLQITDMVSDYQ